MINWTPIVTFPFNVWKQTTPVELRNRKIGEIDVGASHWQLCIVLLDSGIMGMIGKLLLELEYCPRNNRANAKAKPLRTFSPVWCYAFQNLLNPKQTKFLYWVIGWVIVGCQCYQINWQLQSGHTDNQLSPNLSPHIRILFDLFS